MKVNKIVVSFLLISLIGNVILLTNLLQSKQKISSFEKEIYANTLYTFSSFANNLESSIEDVNDQVSFTKMQGNEGDLLGLKNLYYRDGRFKKLEQSFVALTNQIHDVAFEYWNGENLAQLTPQQMEVLKTISKNYSQLSTTMGDIWLSQYSHDDSRKELADIQLELVKIIDETLEANREILK